jgi:DNA-nicking Smr family endonuclease
VAKKILSAEDSELFREAIGTVVRTVKSDKVLLKQQERPKPFPKPRTINVHEHLTGKFDGDIEKVGLDDSLSFVTEGLQKNVLKKLRQGFFGIDAEIDLHGLNSHEAKRQLLIFLHSCVSDHCRCIHIVHGKGYRSADNHPILKNNLNIWLRQHKEVQAFCSAPPRDGGTGAVFVLLYCSAR